MNLIQKTMNREIKFRGKTEIGDRWVVGAYNQRNHTITWNEGSCNDYYVNEDTIGQYTGLKDKNGKEIYEGDIVVKHFYYDENVESVCTYLEDYACFAFVENMQYGNKYYYQRCDEKYLEIIGNIHDNPELLIPVTE